VAEKALRKTNEILAPKIVKKAFSIFGKVLYFTGQPAFFLLSRALIALLFIFYTTGCLFKHFSKALGKSILLTLKIALRSFLSLVKFIKTKVKKIKIPQVKPLKIKLFVISLAKPLNLLRIFLLKLKLYLNKIFRIKIRIIFPKISLRQFFLLSLIFTLIILPLCFLFYIFYGLPSPSELVERNIEVATKIYDRRGELLYNIYKDKNRTVIPLEKIPLHVRLATIAVEDAEFYYHPGFSIKGIMRSIIRNFSKGELTGGSTITQQLVKNALLTPEKTLTRKIREIILAILVEIKYPKDQILEMYLNEVSYGGTAYGIQEASKTYFNKDVTKLSLAEAAVLAGLPKSPTKFSPFGPNPEATFQRQKDVLHLMQVNGFISKEQEDEALAEKIIFAPNKIDIKAPHFVMFVRQILEDTFSKEVVETGGLEVTTTLDYEIQKLTEKVVSEEIEKLKKLHVTNAAVLVLNPKTGEILAMVGSKDYFDKENDGNVNVITSLRQPGSSIKIINYAYALSNGYTLASILSDTPITYLIKGQPNYTPRNYDNTFRGNLTLRSALAESRNVPAVKVLASYGVDKMIEMGKKMGITTWEDKSRFGLSLTLGGGEIKLIDLAKAYATLANKGKRPEIKSLLTVKNYQGKELLNNSCQKSRFEVEENPAELAGLFSKLNKKALAAEAVSLDCKGEQVLDPRVAFLLTDVLKDNNARAPAFGSHSQLVIANHPEVAVKTGTSNNLRDNLTIGYNQDYLVAVWVGNNDNSPMSRVASGITGASPIFNKIMSALLANEPNQEWPVPQGLVKLPICTLTGTLTCEGCPTRLEWFLEENKPEKACDPNFVRGLKEVKPHPQILEPAARVEARD